MQYYAGANTAADHIDVLDQALTQIPGAYRHGHPIMVRTDTGGCTRAFLAHLRSLRDRSVSCEFSVGWAITDRERTAIRALGERIVTAAIDTDGDPRDGRGRRSPVCSRATPWPAIPTGHG